MSSALSDKASWRWQRRYLEGWVLSGKASQGWQRGWDVPGYWLLLLRARLPLSLVAIAVSFGNHGKPTALPRGFTIPAAVLMQSHVPCYINDGHSSGRSGVCGFECRRLQHSFVRGVMLDLRTHAFHTG